MIQKRYQRFTRQGVEWTPWFTLNREDINIENLEFWQLKNKLKNEFQIVDSEGVITPIKVKKRG